MTACGCPDACHRHGRNRTNPEYVVHFSKKTGKSKALPRTVADRFKLGYSAVFKDHRQAQREAEYANGDRKLGENPFGIGAIAQSIGESKIGDSIEHHGEGRGFMKGVNPAIGLLAGIGLFVLIGRAAAGGGNG